MNVLKFAISMTSMLNLALHISHGGTFFDISSEEVGAYDLIRNPVRYVLSRESTEDDYVILLIGPSAHKVPMMALSRIMPFWISYNIGYITHVPSVYSIVSTLSNQEIYARYLHRYIPSFVTNHSCFFHFLDGINDDTKNIKLWLHALARDYSKINRYQHIQVSNSDNYIIRGTIPFRSDFPIGQYRVIAYIIRDTKIIFIRKVIINVKTHSVLHYLYDLYSRRPVLYTFFSTLIIITLFVILRIFIPMFVRAISRAGMQYIYRDI